MQYYSIRDTRFGMSKSKSIRLSELDSSNRKLLAAAQQAGLSSDEIIQKSLLAAHGKLLKPGGGQASSWSSGKNHNHKQDVAKPGRKQFVTPTRAMVNGDLGGAEISRKSLR